MSIKKKRRRKARRAAPALPGAPKYHRKLKQYMGRHPKTGRWGFLRAEDAAYAQIEALAQLEQLAPPKTKKEARRRQKAFRQLTDVAEQISHSGTRNYRATRQGAKKTKKNVEAIRRGEIPPPDERFDFIKLGKAWRGYAWHFLGPEGEKEADELYLLLGELFGGNNRSVRAWTDIGLGPDNGKEPKNHLSTPVEVITSARIQLQDWRSRPSAKPIMVKEAGDEEPVWFMVNLVVKTGTPEELKARNALG